MHHRSHITNPDASGFVRTSRNDFRFRNPHNANMARRGVPKGPVNWYLREWMDQLGVKQRDMIERAGWSKASASQLYNGVQDYSPKIVNEAALALNIAPFELLMRPEQAMALRRVREEALRLVADSQELDRKTEEPERKSA